MPPATTAGTGLSSTSFAHALLPSGTRPQQRKTSHTSTATVAEKGPKLHFGAWLPRKSSTENKKATNDTASVVGLLSEEHSTALPTKAGKKSEKRLPPVMTVASWHT
ncbi:hypothetical protein HK405_001596, partial [Cladochytrium tenue]